MGIAVQAFYFLYPDIKIANESSKAAFWVICQLSASSALRTHPYCSICAMAATRTILGWGLQQDDLGALAIH